MRELLNKVIEGSELSPKEAEELMRDIMTGGATPAQMGAFLTALSIRGETSSEIASFARVMRSFCQKVELPPAIKARAVDTCGTGGDLTGTFNISTVAAFVVAGAGVPVAKHGNRAVSSKSGSADVLEKLGVKIDLGPDGVKRCIEKAGIGFMLAPAFHPAMKFVAGVRGELGVRTVFNILGPMVSPADVKHQVYGVYDYRMTEKLANVLKELGSHHALVVHGMDGLDEISTIGKTRVSELKNGKISTYYIHPKEFKIPLAKKSDLLGDGPEENAQIASHILNGARGPKRDIVVFNAAAAIFAADAAKSIREGVAMAAESLDSGKAADSLKKLIEVSNS